MALTRARSTEEETTMTSLRPTVGRTAGLVLLSCLILAPGLSRALHAQSPPATEPLSELFLGDGHRFRVRAHWQVPPSDQGIGRVIPVTSDTGLFWFFRDSNIEAVTKVLDACTVNDRFWFFAGGLTNVEVDLTVEDTFAEQSTTYHNPAGTPFQPIQDTAALATCGAPTRACGRGTASELAATPRADDHLELFAMVLGGGLTADPAIYQRAETDLAAIRALEPAVADTHFVPSVQPHTLLVSLDDATAEAARAGDYHDWDCLNAWYGGVPRVYTSFPLAAIDIPGVFNPAYLVPDYEALPGIVSAGADANLQLGGPPNVIRNLCATIDGDTYHYFFRQDSQLWYFRTASAGAPPEEVDYLPVGIPEPIPAPGWYPLWEHCSQYLASITYL
jgi:hypothetical protein